MSRLHTLFRSRYVLVVAVILTAFLCVGPGVFAQDSAEDQPDSTAPETAPVEEGEEPPEPQPIAITLNVGGMYTRVTSHVLAEFGWYRGRLGFNGDLFQEFGIHNNADGTEDRRYYVGGSATARLSALSGGRGLYVEAGLGGGNAWLSTIDDGSKQTDSDFNFGVVAGIGVRFGNEKGLFGEAAIRIMLSLREIYLSTLASPPAEPPDDPAAQGVWHIDSIFPLTTVSLGLGYLFPRGFSE
jgi:hypothetical protein